MEYLIETKQLTKRFASKVGVDAVDLHIKQGDIYGFIGKNGAGKTTTMKMILGLLTPTSGEILYKGSAKALAEGRHHMGSLIEAPGLYKGASAYENMKRVSLLCGGDDKEIKELLQYVGLGDVGKKSAGEFSLGMKQRLGIAMALLGHPELLILDEPINGLDPAGIKELRDLFVKLNKDGVTILISSHILDELAKITTTYGIISDGKLVEEVNADELMKRCQNNLQIEVSDGAKAKEVLEENGFFSGPDTCADHLITLYSHFSESAKINRILVKSGIEVSRLAASTSGFEDYFIERMGR